MPTRILIVGYGNPLRGDDGLGWEIVAALAPALDRSVATLAVHQLTPDLAELIHDNDLVIFVDASNEGQPGSWRSEGVRPGMDHSPSMGHHCDVADLLAYTQGLFESCPEAWMISVTGESFGYQEQLSQTVQKAVPAVLHHISQRIANFIPSAETSLCMNTR